MGLQVKTSCCSKHNVNRSRASKVPQHRQPLIPGQAVTLGQQKFVGVSTGSRSLPPVPHLQTKKTDKKQPSRGRESGIGNAGSGSLAAVDLLTDAEGQFLAVEDVEDFELAKFLDAVVKVYCVHTEPNYSLPWQRKRQFSSTSSGFIVSGPNGEQWLLTNAHSVEYYSQVMVKRRGDDQKFLAKVLAIGTECDIALLTVEEDAFWQGVKPLGFGPLPSLQDAVAVVGYPIGGDTISVTSGVVSRIEVTNYVHGSTELLGVQIDAAINSGNSGGPVFDDCGNCVGIAFQSFAGSDAENIGYVIPTPVIEHFLNDYMRNGEFTGFPTLGMYWQRMESKALRASYGMADEMKGVLVRKLAPCSSAAQVLQPEDIVMSFDGVSIASDGTVPFRTGERIAFGYLTSQKYTGQHATMHLLRKGEEITVDVDLGRPSPLVEPHLRGGDPSYAVIAGLIFTPLTEPYLESEYAGDYMREAPVKLLDKVLYTNKQFPDEQVVLLSQVLACEATLGYEELHNIQVKKVNNVAVRNMRHLAEMLYSSKEQYLRFDLDYDEVVVLQRDAAWKATQEMMEMHSIPCVVSRDLRDVVPKDTPFATGQGMQLATQAPAAGS